MQRGQEPSAAGSDAEHPLPSKEGRQRRYKPLQAQHWDEIRVISNPRYKTSDLSGEQWRHSKMIQLVRKGHIVYESDNFSLLDSLQKNISSKLEEQAKKELGNEAWEELADGLPGQTCDQEGCTAEPTNTYRMKAHYDQESGKWFAADPEIDQYHFCDAHSKRGDQDMDDCDDNYEVISGVGPQDPDPDRVAVAAQAFVNPEASHSSEEFEEMSAGKPAETDIPVQRRGKRDRNEEEDEDDPFEEFLSRFVQQQQQQEQQQQAKKKSQQKKGLSPEQLVALAKLLDEPEQGASRKTQRQQPPVNRKQIARMLFNDLVSRHQDDADEGEGDDAEEFV